ncbi:MAG: OmpA family protein [Tannerella sp.]|jgi:outer membrane protein OmpA-like peptidoglycan-associated protein|nr:OmpA family protein [Tannerella sp.]
MRTVKFLTVMLALLMVCSAAEAQGVLNRIGKAAKNAAEKAATRQAERRVEQAVDKAIDKAFEGNDNDANNQQQGNNTQNANVSPGNAAAAPAAGQSLEMAYAKSDFVPGDEIIFDDDQANEKLGEFPSQWDLDTGNAEIVTIDGVKCINLIGYTTIMPLMNPPKDYLPDAYTIEWDYLASDGKTIPACDMDLGIDGYNFFHFRLTTHTDARYYTQYTRPDDTGGSVSGNVKVTPNTWHRVSFSFNKRAVKIYVDGVRVVNAPNVKKGSNFYLFGREGIYIKNIRVAKGAVPLYDRMLTDGKFITYGITFDVGKSTIKPESMGEINRIVTLMTENPDLKFSVEGHTDSTGAAASNQTLSESRSQAVVDKLVENGIVRDRLTAAGKGQTAPIADNGSDEGRAKNRRVEFVKI